MSVTLLLCVSFISKETEILNHLTQIYRSCVKHRHSWAPDVGTVAFGDFHHFRNREQVLQNVLYGEPGTREIGSRLPGRCYPHRPNRSKES